jgi:hypothetical protein
MALTDTAEPDEKTRIVLPGLWKLGKSRLLILNKSRHLPGAGVDMPF